MLITHNVHGANIPYAELAAFSVSTAASTHNDYRFTRDEMARLTRPGWLVA